MTINLPWQHRPDKASKSGNIFSSLQGEINRLFDDFFEDSPALIASKSILPAIDITENDKCFKVEAELPGLEEKDVEVDINDNYLTIKGEKKTSSEDKGENFIRQERYYGNYQRVIALPTSVNSNEAKATFKKGVLSIEIPKKPESVIKSRKLEIQES
jgi:HSP20 family protein